MTQYIDKDALVEEIERLVNNHDKALDYEAALEDMRNFIDTLEVKDLQEDPVSIDFEQELYKAFGQVKDFTLCMRIAKYFYDMGKNNQEPVSEELEEELSKLLKECEVDAEYVHQDFLHIVAHHFANWQKRKDSVVSEELEEAAKQYEQDAVFYAGRNISDFFKAGAKWQITKLMKETTEVTVHIDAGGYPYTPEIELYDYDKDVPLAKEGDKYMVVLIKEDSV